MAITIIEEMALKAVAKLPSLIKEQNKLLERIANAVNPENTDKDENS